MAGDGFKFEFEGFEEFGRILKELSRGTSRRVFRKALTQAAATLEPRLKSTSLWADRSGQLRGALTPKVRTRGFAVQATFQGPLYGRYLEFGWVPGKRPTTRHARRDRELNKKGYVPPRPWIRNTFEASKDGLINQILQDLVAEVTRIINKHAKKKARAGK